MVVCNVSFLKFEMSTSRVENGLTGWFSFKNRLAGCFSFMSHGWVKKQLYVTSDSALCRSGIGEKATLCHHQSEPYHVGRWYMVKKYSNTSLIHSHGICDRTVGHKMEGHDKFHHSCRVYKSFFVLRFLPFCSSSKKKWMNKKIKEKTTNNIASFMGHELCDLDRLGADLGWPVLEQHAWSHPRTTPIIRG